MNKIIKQSSLIILAGIMSLALGCGGSGGVADFAPTSISGKTFNITITSGSGTFDSSGSYSIFFSTSTYVLTEDGESDSGTYTYRRNDTLSTTLTLSWQDDDGDSGVDTFQATFSSANAGTYVATTNEAGKTGSEIGTFTMN